MNSTAVSKRAILVGLLMAGICGLATKADAVTDNYFGTTGTISGNVWSTNPAGPYTSAFSTASGGGVMNFGNSVTAITGASLTVAGINATANVSGWTAGGTISNQGNLVIPINVASGMTLDFGSQSFTSSATAGYNFTGPGTLALAGNTYGGGFTINSGTVIVRGVNALGGNATTNTLTINGGTIAGNANRDLSGKFAGGIALNGNVTIGDTTGLASATATLTINNNINLGGGTRTITIGNNAQHTLNTGAGVISNGGLMIDAVSGATGRILLLGQNTYAGGTMIKGGATLSTNGISSMGSGPITSGPLGVGNLTIDNGTYIPTSSASNTIANNIVLNVPASGENAINVGGGPANLAGNISGLGGFRKGSSGILVFSGTNTYSGVTNVDSGTLALAKPASFYNGNVGDWNDTKFLVNSGATLLFAVGGGGEFSQPQFLSLATVGSSTGGFTDGSNIGIDTTNGGDQTISTVIANTNSGNNRLGLVKSGTGTLFLAAANTHSGPTTVVGGTLNLSHLQALQNSTLTTTATGLVVFDQSAGSTNWSIGGLAGSGSLVLQDSGFSPIALTVGSNNSDASSAASISGFGGSLTKVGIGAQSLSGANSFDGGVTLSGGRLNVNSATALGTGIFTIGAGTTIDNSTGGNLTNSNNNAQVWNGNFTFVGTRQLRLGAGNVTMAGNVQIDAIGTDATNNALYVAGVISDSGSGYGITKTGPGRVYLSGQSTFSGGVTVLNGTIHVDEQSSNLGSGTSPLGTGLVTLNGGRLITSSTNSTVNTIENNIMFIGQAGGDANAITSNGSLTLPGVLSGSGGWTKAGNGSITLTNANTLSGQTTVNAGATSKLVLANELALQNSTLDASSTGGFIDFDGSVGSNAFTLGGLSGDRNLSLTNTFASPITLTIGNNSSDTTHTGILSGFDGSIVKVGIGKSTLAGDNTYTGTTTINNGTLLVNGIHTGGGAYTVNSGGTLGGTGQVLANVAVNSGAAVAPGGAGIESLDTNTLTLASGSQLNFELGAPATADLLNVLTPDGFIANGGTFNFTNAGGMATGTYTLIDYSGVLGGAFGNLALGGTQPTGFTYMLVDNMGNTSIDLQVMSTGVQGDYNLDGKVDAADYVLWRKDPNAHGGDPAGYNTWRQNFGTGSGSGSGGGLASGGAVPEPATWVALLMVSAATLCRRRHNVRK